MIASLERTTQGALIGVAPPTMAPSPSEKAAPQAVQPPKTDAGAAATLRRVFLAERCAFLDLNAIANAVGEEIGVFDERGRLSEEGHQFIAEEMFHFLGLATTAR
jgi:hypothetical protein